MGFERKVPSSASELEKYMQQLHENRGYVKSVRVNLTTAHLEIDLNGVANMAGHPDMYIPIKRDKLDAATGLVERMMRQSNNGYAPSSTDVRELFDMIDPMGR